MQKRYLLIILIVLIAAVIVALLSFSLKGSPASSTTINYTYEVVNTFPHDSQAFTEGLVCQNGFLYESTGLYGSSSLRLVELETGKVIQQHDLDSSYFGEGITIVNDSIVQLTWLEHVGFVYDKTSFQTLATFSYPLEGWGITYDGKHLITSNGTDKLTFLDPSTFKVIKTVGVHDGNVSISSLNELEYIRGDVYANVWGQQKIAIINPETGQVKAWADLTGLLKTCLGSEDVLNGIAYDSANNRLFVTGKNWPNLYEMRLVPAT